MSSLQTGEPEEQRRDVLFVKKEEAEEEEEEEEGSRDEQKNKAQLIRAGQQNRPSGAFLSLLAVGKGAATAEPFSFYKAGQDKTGGPPA